MLQVKNIFKKYTTGDLVQTALDGVSLNLRDNEFVAILGPSGSGKTTLLNVIGGLDRYDSGDLIINGISTKKYKSRDWDAYRNHTIGFVFQSYNLIPHQSVLANVELALTISGISRSERRKRAKEALEQVGLGNQLHKRPNQMSGGQMQRVAIARALVNDPDILLADEPTGALDTETGIQVMELLKEVAKDRLVVMVTHNPELAEQYANRIVRLRDGKILDDTNPFEPDESKLEEPKHQKMGRSSMSFLTALSLSFNNLRTKKGRTILTAFAGSIGIIGISLILSLSNGVNNYITDIQRDTMSSYPITIDSDTIDYASIMNAHSEVLEKNTEHDLDKVYSNSTALEMEAEVTTSITHNNLTAFKKYLDDPNSNIHDYVGENGIIYSYQTRFGVYTHDSENAFVNTDGSTLSDESASMMSFGFATSGRAGMSMASYLTGYQSNPNFEELTPGADGKSLSSAITDNYTVIYGKLPEKYDEVVLILNEDNEISTEKLYQLGILPTSEYKEIRKKLEDGEKVEFTEHNWNYADICKQELYMIPACDTYQKNSDGNYECIADNAEKMEELMKSAVKLNIVGIIRPNEDSSYSGISSTVGYTKALTDYIIKTTDESDIVKAQKASKDINVLNGMKFSPSDDKDKIADIKTYIGELNISEKAALAQELMSMTNAMPTTSNGANENTASTVTAPNTETSQNSNTVNNTPQASATEVSSQQSVQSSTTEVPTQQPAQSSAMEVSPQQSAQNPNMTANPQMPQEMTEEQFASMLDELVAEADNQVLLALYEKYISTGTYDDNMKEFGVISLDAPSSINIYADSFEAKDAISDCIQEYNENAKEEDNITYTDYVGLLMSSVTTIINVISYVLIAFVAVSLVVSSIMIGIITYISVLERTKEIGILRAIGASKRNISQVFNAETFIIGLLAGLLGIGVTLLLLIPGNAIIHAAVGTDTVNASLPAMSGVILVLLSIALTFIGGIIPSKAAAKKDPVTALRSE